MNALKTSWNNFYIRLLYLFVALSVLLTIVVVERQRSRLPQAPLLESGDIDALEIRWKGQTVKLVRDSTKSSEQDSSQELLWTVRQIQERDLMNTRGNQGFITHFVDLLKNATAPQDGVIAFSDKDAAAYGLVDPALAVNLAWKTPSPGEEVVLFGNKDLSEKLVFVFFPRGPKLVKSAATLFKLLEGKTVDDFRDRHMTTFKTDDVESLTTEGPCGQRSLWRNGDHWEWKIGQDLEDTDAWLDVLTEQKFSEETPGTAGSLWCTFTFEGRLGRQETLRVYESTPQLLTAVNSGLPGFYKIPAAFGEALKVTKTMARRPRPKPSPSQSPVPSPSVSGAL